MLKDAQSDKSDMVKDARQQLKNDVFEDAWAHGLRPSTRHFSARPPKRGLIFGLSWASRSPGQLEPSSAK